MGGRGSGHPDCCLEVQMAVWAQGHYLLVLLKGRNVSSWVLTPGKPSSVIMSTLLATLGRCSADPGLLCLLSIHRRAQWKAH